MSDNSGKSSSAASEEIRIARFVTMSATRQLWRASGPAAAEVPIRPCLGSDAVHHPMAADARPPVR
jgi:hypothetical protein